MSFLCVGFVPQQIQKFLVRQNLYVADFSPARFKAAAYVALQFSLLSQDGQRLDVIGRKDFFWLSFLWQYVEKGHGLSTLRAFAIK